MNIVDWVFNLLIFVLNTIIWLFASVLNLIFSLLPNSPFVDMSITYDLVIHKYMGYLSWLLPVKQIISILFIWLGCMLVYYVYSVVMRWIKLIN